MRRVWIIHAVGESVMTDSDNVGVAVARVDYIGSIDRYTTTSATACPDSSHAWLLLSITNSLQISV